MIYFYCSFTFFSFSLLFIRLVTEVQNVALEVSSSLSEVLFLQYPGLRDALRTMTETVLRTLADETALKLKDVLVREKDPFTLNDFLQQWVNKLRFDRFSAAVDATFDSAKNTGSNWGGLKEEVFVGSSNYVVNCGELWCN
jgi:interferon-induced GTP-binding protein Mx1